MNLGYWLIGNAEYINTIIILLWIVILFVSVSIRNWLVENKQVF